MTNQILPFDIKSFQYRKNYALEASAGTGKTFSIKEIVKKLIKDYSLGLDKLLIVTYTEKAAGELKDRIRDALEEKLDELGGQSIKEFVGDRVNCDVDNATIGTIHSFCQNIIKEYSLSSDQPVGLSLADDKIAYDFAKRYIREGDILKDITRLLSIDANFGEDALTKRFVAASAKYYLDSSYNENPDVVTYHKSLSADIGVLMFDAEDPIKCLQINAPSLYDDYCFLKQSSRSEVQQFIALFENYLEFIRDSRGQNAFGITKKNKYLNGEPDAFKNLFKIKDSIKKFKDSKNGPKYISYYLIDKYLGHFYKSFQEYKAKNRLQSFNDMIRMVREAVYSPNSKLLLKLKERFKYGIIDEFQDTNQLQFDIFSKVFLNEDHNIIVVGDPKQSIYSFQGTDVSVYRRAVETISQNGLVRRLDTNYRSYPGVVGFGNELFSFYFGNSFNTSKCCLLSNGGDERRLKYKGKYCPGLWINKQPLSPNEYAKFVAETILDCVSTYKGEDNKTYTNLQVSEIIKTKDQNGKVIKKEIAYRNVDFSDFVVLARARKELIPVKNAFKAADIPNIQYKDTSLFKGLECSQWISLLEAIDALDFTGRNRGLFKKALFTKFFGLTLQDISDPKYDDDNTKEYAMIIDWRIIAKQKHWEELFSRIIIDSELDDRLSSFGESHTLSVYKQLANYATNFLTNHDSLSDLIQNLKSLMTFASSDDEEEDNSSIVAKATDFKCVRLMTMHASKGLQFPVTISVSGFKGRSSSSDAYSYHNPSTLARLVSLEKPDASEWDNEQIEELRRLFYVAYTRPEFLLITPIYNENDDKIDEISVTTYMRAFLEKCANKTFDVDGCKVPLYELKDFVNESYSSLKNKSKAALTMTNVVAIATSEEEKEQKIVIDKLIDEVKDKVSYKHAYSSFAHPKTEQGQVEMVNDETDIDLEGEVEAITKQFDSNGKQIMGHYDETIPPAVDIPENYPRGTQIGNAIHETFERADFEDCLNGLEEIVKERFDANGIDISSASNKPWLDATIEIVKTVLSADLPEVKGNKATGSTFKLCELKKDDRKAEIEFNVNYPNEVLKNYLNGFIDLLFKRGELYSILDWKSDSLNDNFLNYHDSAQLKGQVDERYAIQRVLYSYCLIKWLKNLYINKSEEEIFNDHFGGIYYVFVRGCNPNNSNGIYIQTWEKWADLKNAYLDILENAGKGK